MAKWFILPGMGATSVMYDMVRMEIEFEVNFIDWPEYEGEKTYAEVARRLMEKNEISGEDVVGGSSLGGMVALEIAKILRSKAVVLLGSAVNRQEVQCMLLSLSPLAAIMPVSLIQILAGKHNSLVARMFSESNPEFVRAMCLHLSSWSGYNARWNLYFDFTDGGIVLFRVQPADRRSLKVPVTFWQSLIPKSAVPFSKM